MALILYMREFDTFQKSVFSRKKRMGWVLHYRKYSNSDQDLSPLFAALCFLLFVLFCFWSGLFAFTYWSIPYFPKQPAKMTTQIVQALQSCTGSLSRLTIPPVLDFSPAIIWETRSKTRRKCISEINSGRPSLYTI